MSLLFSIFAFVSKFKGGFLQRKKPIFARKQQ